MEEAPQEAPSKYTEAEEYQRHGCPVPHAPTVVNPCPQCRSAAQGVPPHEVDDQPHACGCCAGTCELCNPELRAYELSSLSTPQPVAPMSDYMAADNRRVTSLSEGATTEWVDNPLNCRLPLGVHLRRIAVRTALYERLLASSTEQSQALYESRPMPQFQGSYAGTAGAGQERYCELCDQRLSSQEALEEHVQGLEHHRAERLRDWVAQECPQLLTSGEGRTL